MYYTRISGIVGAALLASTSFATPLPQDSVTVVGLGQNDPNVICAETLNSDGSNSAQVWVNSGASFFLENFIQQNGESNWVNVLDQKTTSGGTQGISNLDCTDLTGGNCAFPSLQCQFFTPPAVFFIRQAVATAYAVLQSMQNNLFSSSFVQSLGVDKISSDFGLAPLRGDAGILGAFSGGFGAASALVSPVPAVSAVLGFVSGILGIAAGLSNPPAAPPSVALALNDQLAQIFNEENAALAQAATSAFGGSGAIQLPGVGSNPGPNNEVSTAGKFLSGGKFLIPVTSQGSIDSMLKPTFDASSKILKQYLVGVALKSQGFYVFINTQRSQNDCNGITGSRFLDGKCYTLEHRGDTNRCTAVIDQNTVLKLGDPAAGYNIDVEKLYRNAQACQDAHPNFDGKIDPTQTGTDPNNLPTCFFNFPVITADFCPCFSDQFANPNFPSVLGFDRNFCIDVIF